MATANGTRVEDFSFKCDRCEKIGMPHEFAYIGSTNEGDAQCSPLMEWKQICLDCATPEEMERWYGSTRPGQSTKIN